MICKVKDSTAKGNVAGWVDVNLNDDRLAQFEHSLRGAFPQGWNKQFGRDSVQDAAEGYAFQIGELTYLEAKAINKWYDPMMYETLLAGGAIDSSAGPWAKSVDYKSVKQLGIGQFVGPDARYFPMVNVAYEKASIGVASGQIGYEYSQEDLLFSAHMKIALPDDLQSAAVLGYKRHANYVALLGDPSKNFTGLYNNASATAANRLSGAVWDSATTDTIYKDVVDSYGKYVAGTANNEQPSIMVVPVSTYAILLQARSTNSDTTLVDYIEKVLKVKIYQDILLDSTANGGKAPGAGTTKRIVFANPKNDNVVFHVPQPITFLAPQFTGVFIVVPATYKLGGFEVRRIQTVRYMDGV